MIAFKTISKRAAVLSLALMAAGVAHAQSSTTATGSTDIYATNFQQAFTTVDAVSGGSDAPIGTASTDIYRTDFQKEFATNSSIKESQDTATYEGSTDIYSNDFRKSFM
jgi:hypothetical protein